MNKKSFLLLAIACIILGLMACEKPEAWDNTQNDDEWYSGGKQTVFVKGSGAYSSVFPHISSRNALIHGIGDIGFDQTFVSGGLINPGLGPVFNSVSCVNCHIADGRGTPVGPGPNVVSLLLKLSIPGQGNYGAALPIPGFGTQLQHNAIFNSTPEALLDIQYQIISGQFADGSPYELHQPVYSISSPHVPLPNDFLYSPRVAPPVFGLGLLEAVSENTILQYADEWDLDGDGISGKPNYAWDIVNQKLQIGRFGWKAIATSVLQQTAGAYHEDMGITSFIFPKESTWGTPLNQDFVDEPEVSDSLLHAVAHYVRTLAVPARRDVNHPLVQEGKKIFNAIHCQSCHRPEMQTGTTMAFPEVSNQRIFPYSDLLLHDMGPLLADNRPDHLANGQEWRTPPLWGIGLTQVVNGHENFLHDGRATSLSEAILWHGGEALPSATLFKQLSAADREALIAFLKSL